MTTKSHRRLATNEFYDVNARRRKKVSPSKIKTSKLRGRNVQILKAVDPNTGNRLVKFANKQTVERLHKMKSSRSTRKAPPKRRTVRRSPARRSPVHKHPGHG